MTTLSVSTWSLHRALGPVYWDKPGQPDRSPATPYGAGTLSLLDLPAKIADMGIHTLEICHFHLPTLDESYLAELRAALQDAEVKLYSILIDDGDITHPEHAARDRDWIASWIVTAGKLGAERVRVIGGKTPGEDALTRCQAGLRDLLPVAQANNIRLMTENFLAVLQTPDDVSTVLDPLAGQVGLCADFGNLKTADKYNDLAKLMPYAESCHAKCSFTAPYVPDRADYEHCLQVTQSANFDGSYTLIYDGPDDDEWQGLRVEIDLVQPFLN